MEVKKLDVISAPQPAWVPELTCAADDADRKRSALTVVVILCPAEETSVVVSTAVCRVGGLLQGWKNETAVCVLPDTSSHE